MGPVAISRGEYFRTRPARAGLSTGARRVLREGAKTLLRATVPALRAEAPVIGFTKCECRNHSTILKNPFCQNSNEKISDRFDYADDRAKLCRGAGRRFPLAQPQTIAGYG